MNNGVNENQNTLAPMAGVKIAPAQEGPVNASTGNNTSVVNAAPKQEVAQAPVVPQIQTQQPVQTAQQTPVIQPETIVNVPQQVPQAPQLTSQIPDPPKVVKNNSKLVPILLVVVLFLVFFMFYTNSQHSKQIQSLKFNCTPITSKEETKLDVNSTLVKDLYGKVKTNIREDLANPNFDDSMKLYLAYRQIKEHDKYDSNCNLYSGTAMEPFKCEVSTNFVPKAFKEEKGT